MAAMREAWTDERLDDLNGRVDRGFDRVDRNIRGLRTEMDARFNRLEDRFDSMQRMTLAAYLTAIVGLIATQL
jgi:flagellar capping protein FliD